MRLVDANVFLYAVNEASSQHGRARAWLDAALGGQEAVGFAWVVLLAFLRLATHGARSSRARWGSAMRSTPRASG